MEVKRFGLGICFEIEKSEQSVPEEFWKRLFAVLTVDDVKGLYVFGGQTSYGSEEPYYLCVFTNGKLKVMRNVFNKLDADEGIRKYMRLANPYLQNNALDKIEGLISYGEVLQDGSIVGGEAVLHARPLAGEANAGS